MTENITITKTLSCGNIELEIPESAWLYTEMVKAETRKQALSKTNLWLDERNDTVSLNLGNGCFLICRKFAYEVIKKANMEFFKKRQQEKLSNG